MLWFALYLMCSVAVWCALITCRFIELNRCARRLHINVSYEMQTNEQRIYFLLFSWAAANDYVKSHNSFDSVCSSGESEAHVDFNREKERTKTNWNCVYQMQMKCACGIHKDIRNRDGGDHSSERKILMIFFYYARRDMTRFSYVSYIYIFNCLFEFSYAAESKTKQNVIAVWVWLFLLPLSKCEHTVQMFRFELGCYANAHSVASSPIGNCASTRLSLLCIFVTLLRVMLGKHAKNWLATE